MSFKSASDVKIEYTKLFINGMFCDSVDKRMMDVVNPCTTKKIGEVARAGEKDVNLAVKAARAAFPKWRDTAGSERSRILWKWGELIAKNLEKMAALEALDNGKPFKMCCGADVPLSIEQFKFFAGFADKIDGRTLGVPGDFIAYVKKEPYGVCGQIIPWNFPLLMFAWKVCPALACGNTVVIKSSEHTPLSALYCAALGKEAGIPDGVLNVLSGFGPDCGEFIARHPDIDKVSFTGSTRTGRRIMLCSSESNLKNVSLELGGKSPLIVYPDMKNRLDYAVTVCCQGIFFNQGQVCCASSRIFVHEDIYDAFLEKAIEFAKKRKVCDAFDPTHEVFDQGAQNSQMQFDKIMKYIEIGKKEAKCAVGGNAIKKEQGGWFVEPTIFVDVKDDMTIMKEEIFGPVLCLSKFKDTDEVIKRANDTTFGLAAGVMSEDITTALKVVNGVKAGTVWVNCYNIFGANIPFGGFKQSGFGKDCGIYALNNYLKDKVVVISVPGLLVK